MNDSEFLENLKEMFRWLDGHSHNKCVWRELRFYLFLSDISLFKKDVYQIERVKSFSFIHISFGKKYDCEYLYHLLWTGGYCEIFYLHQAFRRDQV